MVTENLTQVPGRAIFRITGNGKGRNCLPSSPDPLSLSNPPKQYRRLFVPETAGGRAYRRNGDVGIR
ncbi:unnamed protein product [Cylicostephanus goldi]|uniref:Uncharacterized protein n=1 Tax=Cylicostephanus goldi TaxID=71465 RepID=A0A3P7R2H0_CYLGO|nr:unnamed protein product [Cylicostephanus goldi]